MKQKSKEIIRKMNKAVADSHSRMLDNALNQRVEVTCPEKLKQKYPSFTDEQITRMARLNHKINVANDYLIEEQSTYLDPSSRPVGGIPYNKELFAERTYDEDEELATIREEQQDIDDQ